MSDDSRQTTAVLVPEAAARLFFEGGEACREYLREPRMWFGVSKLEPGKRGDIDPGHPLSVEVFYCSRGSVEVGDGERSYLLRTGDALIIPPSLPHSIVNVGTEEATVVWAGAPGE